MRGGSNWLGGEQMHPKFHVFIYVYSIFPVLRNCLRTVLSKPTNLSSPIMEEYEQTAAWCLAACKVKLQCRDSNI